MRACIERRALEPRLEAAERLVGPDRRALRELGEDGGVHRAVAMSLGRDPGVELGTAVELDPVEEIATEVSAEHREPFLGERRDTGLGDTIDLEGVDEAVGE